MMECRFWLVIIAGNGLQSGIINSTPTACLACDVRCGCNLRISNLRITWADCGIADERADPLTITLIALIANLCVIHSRMNRKIVLLYLATVLIWGTTWLPIKLSLGVVSPEVSVIYRLLIASALLFATET